MLFVSHGGARHPYLIQPPPTISSRRILPPKASAAGTMSVVPVSAAARQPLLPSCHRHSFFPGRSRCGSRLVRSSQFKPLHAQTRPRTNRNEDTDEMFNDLFDKYGKVVYRRKDKESPAAEADDDSESLAFAVTLAKVANDVKAADIRVLFVKPLVYWTRFFIVLTAFSRPQIDAIASKIRDTAENQYEKVPSGDTRPNSWTLLDFGDVIVHIFLPQQRAFYNLEEFYANATPIELPFDNQKPFRS